MAKYLLTYDLSDPSRNYDDLIRHLEKTYGTAGHVLGSVWLIRTTKTAAEVRDSAKVHLDGDDKLLVVRLAESGWATSNLPKAAEWLRS